MVAACARLGQVAIAAMRTTNDSVGPSILVFEIVLPERGASER